MNLRRINLTLTVIALWALVGSNAFAAKQKAEMERYPALVIEFPKGSSELTAEMKREVNGFIGEARTKERINQVYVAAWADQARVGEGSLSEAEEDLARRRGRIIRAHLEDALKLDVDTFNMARRTDLWGRIFGTEEARVKGHKPAGQDRVALRIQDEGKPSAAVIVVEPVS